MWILKSSKDLLETSIPRSQYVCNSIKTFNFSTLYTIIPYTLLKSRFKELIQHCFKKERGTNVSVSCYWSDFVKSHSISDNKYKQDEIVFDRQHICPVWSTGVSINDWFPLVRIMLRYSPIVGQTSFKGF